MTVQVDLPGELPGRHTRPRRRPTPASCGRGPTGRRNGRPRRTTGPASTSSVTDVPAERFVEARIAVPGGGVHGHADRRASPADDPRGGAAVHRRPGGQGPAGAGRATSGRRSSRVLGAGGFLLVWRRWGKEPKPPATVGDYWREPLDRPARRRRDQPRLRHRRGAAFPSTVVDLAQRRHLTITEEHVERLGPDKVVYHFALQGQPEGRAQPLRARSCSSTLFRGQSATTSEELMAWAQGQPRRRRALPARLERGRPHARWPRAATSSAAATRSGSGGS